MILLVAILVILLHVGVRVKCKRASSCKSRKCGHRAHIPPLNEIQCTHFPTEEVPESHGTSTIVLSCIDYRFIRAVVELVKEDEGLTLYDTFCLAGGSLGYNQTVYPSWPPTWLDTLTLAKQLHGITTIVVVEHMDCGMYKSIYPDAVDPKLEKIHHQQNLQAFQTAMATIEPTLQVRGYLLYLDGESCEKTRLTHLVLIISLIIL